MACVLLPLGPPYRHAADGVWLISSLRRAVPVRSLDGRPCPVSPLTDRILAALGGN